jgi:hypothetical protein
MNNYVAMLYQYLAPSTGEDLHVITTCAGNSIHSLPQIIHSLKLHVILQATWQHIAYDK